MRQERAKRIIFVCVGNSCRSQMAEGFAKHYAKRFGLEVEIASAGTRPEGYVHPEAMAVMQERAIDISTHRSKGIQPEELLGYDYVITMGCSDEKICPVAFRGDARDWAIEDPFGKPIEFYRTVRDQIEQRVIDLLHEIQGQIQRG